MLQRLVCHGVTNALAMLRLLPISDTAKDTEILAPRHQIIEREPPAPAGRLDGAAPITSRRSAINSDVLGRLAAQPQHGKPDHVMASVHMSDQTLNCLLHVPNADLPAVLDVICAVLRPDGLSFLLAHR